MSKILNCTSVETIYKSLENILGGNVVGFVGDNNYRIKPPINGFVQFERPTIEYIKDYFRISNFAYDEVVIHHATSLINKSSFLEQGIYNLKTLAEMPFTYFKEFLQKNDIEFKLDQDGFPFFEYNCKRVTSNYLEVRYKRDQCINGYLFAYSIGEDSNIREIRNCPEIISHLGSLLGKDIKFQWERQSVPSFISFKVKLDDIHHSTFDNENVTKQEKQEFFILKALEFLLIFDAIVYSYPKDHPMVYLKENKIITPEDILSIKKIDDIE
ncbi:hypothetical protein [Bacillus salipaludis]|uniref:Uncharacterized protein n=1 Tax=Bacillus salipaludis TaxID=2547811 RepID=A0AA90TWG8_9BACI|nr:hypothetical protein [Bacillus salipaludis]MDQ6600756.1 hypothetical protein [Bacillus salipaludis]